MATSTITLTAADGFKSSAYVAEPAGTPKGAIVVLQEIFGVNSHIRGIADRYAAAGYLAIAPATFDRVEQDIQLGYTPDDVNQGVRLKAAVEALPAPGVLQDIQAAVDHAAKAGKVGIVGYCWGGLLVWRAAEQVRGLSAAVAYYGGGMTPRPGAGAQACRADDGAFRRPGQAHHAGHREGLRGGAAGGRGASVRGRPWFQLRAARLLQRRRRGDRAGALAVSLRQAPRVDGERRGARSTLARCSVEPASYTPAPSAARHSMHRHQAPGCPMKSVSASVLGAVIGVIFTAAACAQSVMHAPVPASAPVPAPAASKPILPRSTAVRAAEKSNEPGTLRPEQRVIPQISMPLKSANSPSPAAPAASLPAGSVPGAVNDGAARCRASSGAKEMAACERGLAASGPLKMGR